MAFQLLLNKRPTQINLSFSHRYAVLSQPSLLSGILVFTTDVLLLNIFPNFTSKVVVHLPEKYFQQPPQHAGAAVIHELFQSEQKLSCCGHLVVKNGLVYVFI